MATLTRAELTARGLTYRLRAGLVEVRVHGKKIGYIHRSADGHAWFSSAQRHVSGLTHGRTSAHAAGVALFNATIADHPKGVR